MLGFAAGGLLTERGVFDFLISGLTPPIFSLSDATSLPALLGITPAWVILGVVGFVGFLLSGSFQATPDCWELGLV